jgi:hypothetical protein
MLTVFVILMAFWISKNEGRIYHWIYIHFVQIAMTHYFTSIAGLYFLREKMKHNLRSDRLFHLSKVWNHEDSVFVGHNELKATNLYLRKAGVDVQGGTNKLGYKVPKVENAEVISLLERKTMK